MEKKQERKGFSTMNSGVHQGATLREENTGKKHVHVSSILKMQHLQRLATWAAGEAKVPPLGALFGSRLAANAEAAGVPLDPSCYLCERCESILQPGINCTIRVEKNKSKARRHKNHQRVPAQNNTVYTCHFCRHRNSRGGTLRGHVKSLLASRPTLDSDPKSVNKLTGDLRGGPASEHKTIAELTCCRLEKDSSAAGGIPFKKILATPPAKSENFLQRKRKSGESSVPGRLQMSGDNSSAATGSMKGSSQSSMRRRKSWSRLKDIAESNEAENSRNIGSLLQRHLFTMTDNCRVRNTTI